MALIKVTMLFNHEHMSSFAVSETFNFKFEAPASEGGIETLLGIKSMDSKE